MKYYMHKKVGLSPINKVYVNQKGRIPSLFRLNPTHRTSIKYQIVQPLTTGKYLENVLKFFLYHFPQQNAVRFAPMLSKRIK